MPGTAFTQRCILAAALAIGSSASQAEIVWSVVNGFPLLEDQQFKAVRDLWESKRHPEPKSMGSFVRMRLGDKESGSISRHEFLLAEPRRSNRDIARLLREKSAMVELRSPGTGCHWQVEPPVPRGDKSPVDGDCTTTMQVRIDQPYRVSVKGAAGQQRPVVVRVREVVVAAIGDSYGSGEGSPDRPTIYPEKAETPPYNDWFMRGLRNQGRIVPAVWWDPVCHRSLLSWPALATLRLALEDDKSVVYLVDAACSGAEFLDGIFWAQDKTSVSADKQKDGLTTGRDGLGRRGVSPAGYRYYLPRSQVNAVRDVLCTDPRRRQQDVDVELPDQPFQVGIRACDSLIPLDALLLSGGGNDAQFAAGVRGILLPKVAETPLIGGAALALFRKFAQAISPSQLADGASAWRGRYPAYLKAIEDAVGADASRTLVLGYPDPVGSDSEACRKPEVTARIRNSFMAFGPAVREYAPAVMNLFMGGWTVEIDDGEAKAFIKRTYPQIKAMQETAGDRLVPWLGQPGASSVALAGRDFADRLLCSDAPTAVKRQFQLEPFFFCSGNECEKGAPAGEVQLFGRKTQLDAWHFEAPGRRLVNTANDALLAQRSWIGDEPQSEELLYAIAGIMHPTAEAHAVGADAAYARLRAILKTPRSH